MPVKLSNPKYSRQITVKPLYGVGGEVVGEQEIEKIIGSICAGCKDST